MDEATALATLGMRRGATPLAIRQAYTSLTLKHHPDKGGDARLFQRVCQAYGALRNNSGGAGMGAASSAQAPPARVTREDAPSRWGRRRESDGGGGALLLEHDAPLEAAFRYAKDNRHHVSASTSLPRGYDWDGRAERCTPECLLHIKAAQPPAPTGTLLCDKHMTAHACTADVCCSEERLCPLAVLSHAVAWRRKQSVSALLAGDALERHRCSADGCRWVELKLEREGNRGGPKRGVFLCGSTGRPHLCSSSQCQSGREVRVLDERGGLARQWVCAISKVALGPLMPWQDGTVLALGGGEAPPVGRLMGSRPPPPRPRTGSLPGRGGCSGAGRGGGGWSAGRGPPGGGSGRGAPGGKRKF